MGLATQYKNLGDDEINIASGKCRLQGRNLLIIDKRLSVRGKWKAIAGVLKTMDTSGAYIPPLARELIDSV